jgi:tetratricopeptide (TPR) repeat protein
MIVKNESKIITRLFDSVSPIIDCYCICDTGSTDNTIELIETYFQSKNIPGKVIKEPFKNFCYNRNYALQGCLNMSDYVLLLDADMILEIKKFDKSNLNKAHTFCILQGNNDFYYQNVRIIKNNGLYNYVGVTHEYINTPDGVKMCFAKDELFIRDVGDGGAKHDKFERDVALLLDGIKNEPTNERYHFYLANSYFDSGKFENAIEMYNKRIELNGWHQEIWYSYYRLGFCYKNLNQMDSAICAWMHGYHVFPNRLEGIYEIIKHYRIISKHKLCELFYNIAIDVLNKNINRDDYLFLHNDVYTYKLYNEYTIFSCYLGIKNINNEVIKIMNATRNDIDLLLSNMKFYKYVLTPQKQIILDEIFVKNIDNQNITFHSSSSSLIPFKDGYKMNTRFVNYYINEHGNYLNCDKNIITMNSYSEFDKQFNLTKKKRFDLIFDNRKYIGVEDVRLFTNDKEEDIFLGTTLHKDNNLGIVIGNYNVNADILIEHEMKQYFNQTNCEKNWVFVDYKNSTHIIYSWYPLTICSNNDELTSIKLAETKEMPLMFSRFRGSTCGFKYLNEIWFVTHIVSYESPRHYYHVIVVFDENLNLLRYSAPFKFEGTPIEYCLSIVVEDERVLINYSNWDRTTRIGIYDKQYIENILQK